MSKEARLQAIREMIVDRYGIEDDKITAETRFKEDLGADSLDVVEFVMTLEDRFGHNISDKTVENIETIGDLLEAIHPNCE